MATSSSPNRRRGGKKTFNDALIVADTSDYLDCAYPQAMWDADAEAEYRAEQAAENAWLVAAESAGWQEAHLESLIESGLIARPW